MNAPAQGDDQLALVELEACDDLDQVAAGILAGRLTVAFVAARDAAERLGDGASVVFIRHGDGEGDGRGPGASAAAIAALTRTLALEWAPRGIRVNAVSCRRVADAGDAVALLASPAGAMATGMVLEAR